MTITPVPFVYGLAMKSILTGKVDLNSHTIKAMLCTTGYVPNQNSHQFKSSVTNEAVGSGYSVGGVVITGLAMSYTAKVLTITGSPAVWPGVTFANVRYLVVYDDSYDLDAAKPLLFYVDFGEPKSVSAQSFYYNWPSNTLFKLSVP